MEVKINTETMDIIIKKLSEGNIDKIRAGYLLGTVGASEVEIYDVYVPAQKSTKVSTDISPEEQRKAVEKLKRYGRTIVGFAQYNAQGPAFENATTKETREKLVQDGISSFAFGFVANAKGAYRLKGLD